MSDALVIKGMQFRGYHGVHAYEKQEGNNFEVDVIFKADLTKPGTTDQLDDAIDYTKVHQIAEEVMAGSSVDLIEHLCFQIGSKIEGECSESHAFEIRVRKLDPPLSSETKYTEVRMSWPRS